MKYQISITKTTIITTVILIIGATFLFKGINSYYKYANALPLESLNEQMCKKGAYVTGNISNYIGKKHGKNFIGVSHTLLTINPGKAYDFYVVPTGADSYIRIMVYRETTRDKLKGFTDGAGENIYFEGEIIPPPTEMNNKFYEQIEGFNTADIIAPFVIKEINPQSRRNTLYLGCIVLFWGILLFFSTGGIKNIITQDTVGEEPRPYNYANSYNLDNELLIKETQLQSLEQKLHSLKNMFYFGLAVLLLGVYIIVRSYFGELTFGGLLLILILARISTKNIWRYFINSANSAAIFLANKFNFESLSIKISRCEDDIENIKKNM